MLSTSTMSDTSAMKSGVSRRRSQKQKAVFFSARLSPKRNDAVRPQLKVFYIRLGAARGNYHKAIYLEDQSLETLRQRVRRKFPSTRGRAFRIVHVDKRSNIVSVTQSLIHNLPDGQDFFVEFLSEQCIAPHVTVLEKEQPTCEQQVSEMYIDHLDASTELSYTIAPPAISEIGVAHQARDSGSPAVIAGVRKPRHPTRPDRAFHTTQGFAIASPALLKESKSTSCEIDPPKRLRVPRTQEERRAQNRAAAARCRAREKEKFDALLSFTKDLTVENRRLGEFVDELQEKIDKMKILLKQHESCSTPVMESETPILAESLLQNIQSEHEHVQSTFFDCGI